MTDNPMSALRDALAKDPALQERFAAATTDADIVALAREAGIELAVEDLSEDVEVSDAELAQASGGYTFPATDWIYCDNPWTNEWCTLKC